MLTAITTGVTNAISMTGSVISAIVEENGAWSAILPVVGLSIGLFIVSIAISTVKKLIKGY